MAENTPTQAESQETAELNQATGGSFYRPGEDTLRARGWFKRNKRKTIVGGILSVFLVSILGGIFSLLAPLKLDFMGKNIEETRLARLERTFNGRSQRFMYHMMMAEIAGNEGGNLGQNRYFIAKGWYASANPMTQWYKDLRTDRFLDVLQNDYGVVFASEGGTGRGRLAAISTAGLGETEVREMRRLIQEGRLGAYENRVINHFDSNQAARRFVRKFVADGTHGWQVLKRRHLRLWMGERLGIRRWRFFENTRENSRKAIRSRWSSFVGNSTTGKILTCIFSFALCDVDSPDLNDSDNRSTNGHSQEMRRAINEAEGDFEDGKVDSTQRLRGGSARGDNRSTISKIISSKIFVFRAVNVIDLLNITEAVDSNISNKRLSKMVAVARAAEYATAYATFLTLTDQVKEGENVSGEEVNAALEMFNCAEFSDGFQQVSAKQNQISGSFTFGKAYAQQGQRNSKDCPEYAEVTDEMRVNSNSNGAQKIEDWYNSTIGPVLGVVTSAWRGLKQIPVIGQVIQAISSAINFIGEQIINGALAIADFVWDGSRAALEKLLAKLGEEIITALGAQPVCTGYESGGRLFNCIDGGATVTNEQFLASIGGKQLTQSQVAELDAGHLAEKTEAWNSESLSKKLFSKETPHSMIARASLALPANGKEALSSIKNFASTFLGNNIFSTIQTASTTYFGNSAVAAVNPDSNLYGVSYYGFTDKELDSEPWNGKSASACEAEKESHTLALEGDSDTDTADTGPTTSSICKLDDTIAEALKSFFTEEDDGGLGQGVISGPSGGTGGISGKCSSLKTKILSSNNISFESQNPQNDIKNCVAKDQLTVLLAEILSLKPPINIRVSVIKSGHSPCTSSGKTSNHFSGLAVDIGNEEVADKLMPWLFENRQKLKIEELFFDGLPQYNIDNSQPSGAIGGHSNHIHISVEGPKQGAGCPND